MVAKSIKRPRRRLALPKLADHPLLRVLLAESTRRGDTLSAMAAHLGVSYQHVTQWRRGDYDIGNATRPVLEAAARYLKVPTAIVLSLAGVIRLADFSSPSKGSALERLHADLERMRHDPYFAGFVPEALGTSDLAVRRFVAFLYRELSGGCTEAGRQFEWVRAMNLAAMGHAQALGELAELMKTQASK